MFNLQSDGSVDAGELLNGLLAAIRPAVEHIDRITSEPAAKTVVVVTASPVALSVVHQDADGRARRVYQQPGNAVLGDAIGAFIGHGLGRLPNDAGALAVRLVDEGRGELCVVVDVDLGHACAALVPRGLEAVDIQAAMVLLFTVEGKPTLH